MTIPGSGISFSKDETQIGGLTLGGNWHIDGGVGLNIS